VNLLKLRSRFRAIKSLNSILAAMEVVTTVRLRRAKEQYARTEVYLRPMREVLRGRVGTPSFAQRSLVVLNSSRGLCGGFNVNLLAAAGRFAGEFPGTAVIPLGTRGSEKLIRQGADAAYIGAGLMENLSFQRAGEVLRSLSAKPAEIHIAYNAYRGSIVLKPTVYRLYPVPEELGRPADPEEIILEPSPPALLGALLDHYVQARFYQLLLSSLLAELTSRLMVLNSAVRNSRDLISGLQLSINKQRQATITRELSEVVASAEILRRNLDED
jgi:F-type H+-transporting ATPase subunit gamma